MGGGKASVFSSLLRNFRSTASNRSQWEPLFRSTALIYCVCQSNRSQWEPLFRSTAVIYCVCQSNRSQWEPLFPFPSGRHVAQIGDIRVVFSAQFSSMNFVEHENGEPARKYFKMMKIAFFVVLSTETVNRWYFLVWGAK